MEVGTKVKVRPLYCYAGMIGTIIRTTGGGRDAIAIVKFDSPWIGTHFTVGEAPLFFYKLIDIGKPKPIKLKKFSAWK